MILIPNRFCYVLTPRTGSRAMEQAFLDHVPNAQDIGRHHGFTDCGLPVYATIRNPVDQVLSHWWKLRTVMPLEQYIELRTPRLNIHHSVIDRYYIYEDGLESIFSALGYPGIKIKRIGGSQPDRDYLTPERVHLIEQAFPDDVDIYMNVLGSRNVASNRSTEGRSSQRTAGV